MGDQDHRFLKVREAHALYRKQGAQEPPRHIGNIGRTLAEVRVRGNAQKLGKFLPVIKNHPVDIFIIRLKTRPDLGK